MWWLDVVIVLILIAGVWSFVIFARTRTRQLSRRTTRRAEDMYDEFADSRGAQKRFARRRAGSWRDNS